MSLLKSVKKIFNPNTKEYWDKIYTSELLRGAVRQDKSTSKIIPLLEDKKNILDFGSGPVGNIKLLADNLTNKNFYLLDYSVKATEFAQNNYLGDRDSRGNTFYYLNHIDAVSEKNFDAILALEVLEHIIDYQELLDHLWNLLEKNGILIISVPVKGLRNRHREHLNHFTIRSMFDILCKYSEWIHISLRTHSKRSGILACALFCIYKT